MFTLRWMFTQACGRIILILSRRWPLRDRKPAPDATFPPGGEFFPSELNFPPGTLENPPWAWFSPRRREKKCARRTLFCPRGNFSEHIPPRGGPGPPGALLINVFFGTFCFGGQNLKTLHYGGPEGGCKRGPIFTPFWQFWGGPGGPKNGDFSGFFRARAARAGENLLSGAEICTFRGPGLE